MGRANTRGPLRHCALPLPGGQQTGEWLDGSHHQGVGSLVSAKLDKHCLQGDDGWTHRHCTMSSGNDRFVLTFLSSLKFLHSSTHIQSCVGGVA